MHHARRDVATTSISTRPRPETHIDSHELILVSGRLEHIKYDGRSAVAAEPQQACLAPRSVRARFVEPLDKADVLARAMADEEAVSGTIRTVAVEDVLGGWAGTCKGRDVGCELNVAAVALALIGLSDVVGVRCHDARILRYIGLTVVCITIEGRCYYLGIDRTSDGASSRSESGSHSSNRPGQILALSDFQFIWKD